VSTDAAPEASEDRSDRRQYYVFLQDTISRMASASAKLKSWLLPIITAAYGLTVTGVSGGAALLGAAACLVFGLLDASYLGQEKAFRDRYKQATAADSAIQTWDMESTEASLRRGLLSWSTLGFYLPLLVVGVLLWFLMDGPLSGSGFACWLAHLVEPHG